MAHIHLPDGVFPPLWVLFWRVLTVALITIALVSARRQTIPTLQPVTAAMVAASCALSQENVQFAGGDVVNATRIPKG